MVNEHDDQYEGAEEGEYHFSDEETGYEAEPTASKPTTASPLVSGLAGVARSKRMLISLGVFLALVFVVYKMVSPSSSSTPSTDITAAPAASSAPMTQAVPASAPSAAPAPAPAAPAQNQAVQEPNTMGQGLDPTAAQYPPAAPAAPVAQMQAPAPAPSEAGVQQASMTMPPAAPTTPDVMPVQSSVPANAVAAIQTMETQAQQASTQLETQYAQQIATYQSENKALQDQVQTLNARVASMETEMSQLVQTLTKQFQNAATPDGAVSTDNTGASPDQSSANALKLPYSVQAIIPGRAWLRSDNGDTLTVAEGDVIKDVGQVTKIDPYDGVVEIKVGDKTVSLSYGNGG